MLSSFLLSVREGLEAALIIGIVLAALRKLNRSHLAPFVWQGVLAAIALSILAGLALAWLGAKFEGRLEEIFEGTMMVIAAILLTWMIFWMRRQSSNLQSELEADVQKAAGAQGSRRALAWLAFLAVGREGFELVLFLTAVQMASNPLLTVIGAILGLGAAILAGWLLFTSSRRMSLRTFFGVTNILLVLFAAGLLAHGIHEFNEAGLIPPLIEHVWDLNPILDEKGIFGQILTALFGYNGNPSLTESLIYVAYLLAAWVVWRKLSTRPVLQSAG